MLTNAYEFALRVHSNQLYGNEPYINHPLRVMAALPVNDPALRIAGLLHDVIEDGAFGTESSVRFLFGDYICTDILGVTRNKNAETYTEFIRRCALSPRSAQIKIADLRDHLSRLTPDHPKFSLKTRYENALSYLLDSQTKS
jgi:(p)ppGpp synthase/HD superfamily hydrolase